MANSIMNEMVPRAQAVDPSAQGPADAKASEMPGFGTGGVDELKMRFAIADMRNEQLRAKAVQDRVDTMKAQHYIQDAQRTWTQTVSLQ